MLAIVAIVLFLSSCNYKNKYEEKAEEFINLYYAQYEKKDEQKKSLILMKILFQMKPML